MKLLKKIMIILEKRCQTIQSIVVCWGCIAVPTLGTLASELNQRAIKEGGLVSAIQEQFEKHNKEFEALT